MVWESPLACRAARNVHFRHTARLINALIAAQKPYQLLLFPNDAWWRTDSLTPGLSHWISQHGVVCAQAVQRAHNSCASIKALHALIYSSRLVTKGVLWQYCGNFVAFWCLLLINRIHAPMNSYLTNMSWWVYLIFFWACSFSRFIACDLDAQMRSKMRWLPRIFRFDPFPLSCAPGFKPRRDWSDAHPRKDTPQGVKRTGAVGCLQWASSEFSKIRVKILEVMRFIWSDVLVWQVVP